MSVADLVVDSDWQSFLRHSNFDFDFLLLHGGGFLHCFGRDWGFEPPLSSKGGL